MIEGKVAMKRLDWTKLKRLKDKVFKGSKRSIGGVKRRRVTVARLPAAMRVSHAVEARVAGGVVVHGVSEVHIPPHGWGQETSNRSKRPRCTSGGCSTSTSPLAPPCPLLHFSPAPPYSPITPYLHPHSSQHMFGHNFEN